MRRNSLDTSGRVPRVSTRMRVTSVSSATRSATRRSARPRPSTISGSGATRSVHCRGTAHTSSWATESRSRIQYRFDRSATQANCCPPYGWNGWVMRTRRVDGIEEPAFCVELEKPGTRPEVYRATAEVPHRRPELPDREAAAFPLHALLLLHPGRGDRSLRAVHRIVPPVPDHVLPQRASHHCR